MKVEWDSVKAESNLKKHKVSFEEAKMVFNDPFHLSIPDEFNSDKEERWITLGVAGKQSLVVTVSHTYREADNEDVIRIISARKATPKEKRFYSTR